MNSPFGRTYPLYSWIHPRLEARPSVIQGLGTFASAPICEGETVVIWGGRLFSRADLEAGLVRERSAVPLTDEVHLGVYLDEPVELDEYMNHSCAPNVWMADEVTLVAMRDIAAGEEVTLDYATFEIDPRWTISCDCGATCCRGVVTGRDWQLEQLQAKYKRGMSPYIQQLAGLGERSWR